MRETEINLKYSIEKIWKRIDKKFNLISSNSSEQVLSHFSGLKTIGLLTRLYEEIFETNQIILHLSSGEDTGLIQMYLQEKQIGVIKFVAKRVDIQFDIPDIKLSVTDSNILINYKLIKTIIKDIKLKIN